MTPETILIAEDDSDDLFLLKHVIGEIGLTNPIETAGDGEVALKVLENAVKVHRGGGMLVLPLFFLLDLKMPRMNGFEVLERIREYPELNDLVTVVLTGSDVQSDVLRAYQLGARSYLVKPPVLIELKVIAQSAKEMASRDWLRAPSFPGLTNPAEPKRG